MQDGTVNSKECGLGLLLWSNGSKDDVVHLDKSYLGYDQRELRYDNRCFSAHVLLAVNSGGRAGDEQFSLVRRDKVPDGSTPIDSGRDSVPQEFSRPLPLTLVEP